MKYQIVELAALSGTMATVYTVLLDGDETSLFDYFLSENAEKYPDEVQSILKRLREIGSSTGAREKFFKHDEGIPGDGVCALYDDPDSHLRLYCIRYGSVAIILGGGGPKEVRAWQDDPKLEMEAREMIDLSASIITRISNGELSWSSDGAKLLGDLAFNNDSADSAEEEEGN